MISALIINISLLLLLVLYLLNLYGLKSDIQWIKIIFLIYMLVISGLVFIPSHIRGYVFHEFFTPIVIIPIVFILFFESIKNEEKIVIRLSQIILFAAILMISLTIYRTSSLVFNDISPPFETLNIFRKIDYILKLFISLFLGIIYYYIYLRRSKEKEVIGKEKLMLNIAFVLTSALILFTIYNYINHSLYDQNIISLFKNLVHFLFSITYVFLAWNVCVYNREKSEKGIKIYLFTFLCIAGVVGLLFAYSDKLWTIFKSFDLSNFDYLTYIFTFIGTIIFPLLSKLGIRFIPQKESPNKNS